jgi:hypothetical protein
MPMPTCMDRGNASSAQNPIAKTFRICSLIGNSDEEIKCIGTTSLGPVALVGLTTSVGLCPKASVKTHLLGA